jgi:hypothetical protein
MWMAPLHADSRAGRRGSSEPPRLGLITLKRRIPARGRAARLAVAIDDHSRMLSMNA